MFRQIRWRLVRWNIAIISLIVLIVGTSAYVVAARRLYGEVDRELETRGNAAIGLSRALERDEFTQAQAGYRGGFFFLGLNQNGDVLANPQQVHVPKFAPLATDTPAPYFSTLLVNGEEVRVYIRPLPPTTTATPSRLPLAAVAIGESLVSVQTALHRLLVGLILGSVVGLLLLFVGAWILARQALIPIEQAFQQQQEFIADASHELRTPLTVLRSAADLLDRHKHEPLTANGELFTDLRDGLGRLEHLANDLLTIARSDLNEQQLDVAPLDLNAIVQAVVRQTGPLAQAQQLQLHAVLAGAELLVEADPDRLHQVLLILLDNAIAHTPADSTITVGVAQQGSMGIITVVDTGEGIAAADLPRIFDRFYRADGARARTTGGTGLGLAIAQALVTSHGGQINAASTPGRGTTMTLALPLLHQPQTLANRLGQIAARAVGRDRPYPKVADD